MLIIFEDGGAIEAALPCKTHEITSVSETSGDFYKAERKERFNLDIGDHEQYG